MKVPYLTPIPSRRRGNSAGRDLQERALLQRLAWGDREAFWSLWLPYRPYLHTCCRNWMGNAIEAEEALSQVQLKVWEKLPSHAEKIANVKAWLRQVAHHTCMDIYRERARHAQNWESLDAILVKEETNVLRSRESPESSVLCQEMNQHIQSAIANLPERLREPFVWRCCQEISYGEIAARLNLSQANARKRVQRARMLLQKELTRYGLGRSPSAPVRRSS